MREEKMVMIDDGSVAEADENRGRDGEENLWDEEKKEEEEVRF
jgi:hypothetical protein